MTGLTPQQTGITSSCKVQLISEIKQWCQFRTGNDHHLVVLGDTCASIASDKDISLSNFYSWNPAVESFFSSLWLGYCISVGISGIWLPYCRSLKLRHLWLFTQRIYQPYYHNLKDHIKNNHYCNIAPCCGRRQLLVHSAGAWDNRGPAQQVESKHGIYVIRFGWGTMFVWVYRDICAQRLWSYRYLIHRDKVAYCIWGITDGYKSLFK